MGPLANSSSERTTVPWAFSNANAGSRSPAFKARSIRPLSRKAWVPAAMTARVCSGKRFAEPARIFSNCSAKLMAAVLFALK